MFVTFIHLFGLIFFFLSILLLVIPRMMSCFVLFGTVLLSPFLKLSPGARRCIVSNLSVWPNWHQHGFVFDKITSHQTCHLSHTLPAGFPSRVRVLSLQEQLYFDPEIVAESVGCVLALPLTHCVLCLSKPQFPHLYNGDMSSTCLLGCLWGLEDAMHVKSSEQCLAHSGHLADGSGYYCCALSPQTCSFTDEWGRPGPFP